MLLTIDAGNTNITFALFNQDALLLECRLASGAHQDACDVAKWLESELSAQQLAMSVIDAVIIASVIPYADAMLHELCIQHLGITPHMIGHAPFDNIMPTALDEGVDIGADRIVNAYMAWQRHQQACVIIDFGTATTFDVVNAEGVYSGGVIAPGVYLSLSALEKAASKLPSIHIAATDAVIGRNTEHAMQSGMFWGYVSMVEGLLSRISSELGMQPKVIATGGLAELYSAHITEAAYTDPQLTVDGLRHIYHSYDA